MARNALMPQMQMYEAGPGPQLSNLTNPLMQGLQTYRQGMQQKFEGERALATEARQGEQLQLAKNADSRSAQSHEMEQQKAKVQQIAGLAQMADQERDPARKSGIMNSIYQRHPELVPHLQKNGFDPADHASVPKMLIAEARGYVDPLTEEAKRAQIEHSRAATAASNAQAQQLKMQTPEYRARIAPQFNLQPGSPEHTAFVINGTYTPKDDTMTLTEGQTVARKVRGPDGQVIGAETIVPGQPKAPPEHISKTANFAGRMIEAERHVRRMTEGIDPISGAESKKFGATDWNAGVANALPEIVGNQVRSPEHQQYRQAAQQWIRAFLRKESGAAISPDEFVQDFKTYFPQPGDSADVVTQKQAARAAAMNGFALEAGDYFTKQRPDLAQHLKLYGSTSPDATIKTAPGAAGQPGAGSAPPRITNDAEWARLPPGTTYIAPDGKQKVKR